MTTCEELDIIHRDTVRAANRLYEQLDGMHPSLVKPLVSMLRDVLVDFTVKLHEVIRSEGFNTYHQSSWSDWEYRQDIKVYLDNMGLREIPNLPTARRVHRLVITLHPSIPSLIYSEGPAYMGSIRGLVNLIRAAREREKAYDYCSTCHYYTLDSRLRLCGRGLELVEGCTGYREGAGPYLVINTE